MPSTRSSILIILTIILGSLLVPDFLFWEHRHDIKSQLGTGRSSDGFKADVNILGLLFRSELHNVTATVDVRIDTNLTNREIRSLAYGYQTDTDGTSGELKNCSVEMKECFTAFEDVALPGAPGRSSAKIYCSNLPIRLSEDRAEIWYPFDRFSFKLDFIGWVNKARSNLGASNLVFNQVLVTDSEPNYVLRRADGRYSLIRRPFIRIVSGIFFVLSLVFLIYLTRLSDPNELLGQSLGFFGALWGLRALLVPSSVTVFPTLIDYVILSEFCVLFMIIVSKLKFERKS